MAHMIFAEPEGENSASEIELLAAKTLNARTQRVSVCWHEFQISATERAARSPPLRSACRAISTRGNPRTTEPSRSTSFLKEKPASKNLVFALPFAGLRWSEAHKKTTDTCLFSRVARLIEYRVAKWRLGARSVVRL